MRTSGAIPAEMSAASLEALGLTVVDVEQLTARVQSIAVNLREIIGAASESARIGCAASAALEQLCEIMPSVRP